MGGADAAEVKSVVAVQSVLQMFSVEQAMLAIEKLRIAATGHHQQFVVQGRKAMLELMSQVYEQYYSAKISNEFETFMNNVRNKLKQNDFKPRESSRASSLLIRLIFSNFDDKQIHVYGRSLDAAFERETLPEDFKLFVGTEGGFEGIRDPKKPVSNNATKLAIAISVIANEPTINTMIVNDWADGEEYRIYIAVSNDDGTANLKDSKLEKEHLDATLLLVKADKERRENPPKPKKASVSEINKAVLLQFETLLKNEQAKQAQLKLQYKAAFDSGNFELGKDVETSLATSIAMAYEYEGQIADLREKSKQKSD
ncbi:hypothetical protein D0T24_07110 [Duganella sp. BJB480]|nr:hypothetical protein D0T24_07110 [Duganella sp. BJB480]